MRPLLPGALTRLRPSGRTLELLGDLPIGPCCRLSLVPGAAVGIDLGIGDLSQGAVRVLALLE